MGKIVIAVLAFFVFTGFGFNFGGPKKAQEKPSKIEEEAKQELLQQDAPKMMEEKVEPVVQSTNEEKPASDVDDDALAGGNLPHSVVSALGSDGSDPDLLRQRIESLARVTRALKALSEAKEGKTPA